MEAVRLSQVTRSLLLFIAAIQLHYEFEAGSHFATPRPVESVLYVCIRRETELWVEYEILHPDGGQTDRAVLL
jgi:hypothetical protein